MGAVKEKALNKFVGTLYVAPISVDFVDKDDWKSLTGWTRLASVRGLKNEIKTEVKNIKADDTGTVASFVKPEANIMCTFLESSDAAVMDLILPGTRTTDAGVSETFVISKISQEMPRLRVKIHCIDPASTDVHIIGLSDAVLNGTYSQSFLDVAESGDIEGSNIVFDLNDGGFLVDYNEII